MYCSKCGKQIDYNATVCNECKAAEASGYYYYGTAPAGAPASAPVPSVQSTRMVGFGKALAGTIVSFIGYIFSVIGMVLAIYPAGAIVLTLLALSMGIVSLVFGIQSIKTFKALKNGPGGSPIATLILGIASTAWAGFVLLFALIASFVIGVVLAGALI